MKVLIREKLSPHKFKTPEGYLICQDAILARTGKQTYRKNELFLDTEDDSEIEVDRPYEEVMSQATLASFENKPITIEHPDEDVTVDNYKDYAVGFVRDIRQSKVDGEDVIIGNLVITDKEAIEKIESGEMVELSCGYDCDIVDDDNPRQTHIRGNHLALCEQGRAGIAKIVDSVNDKESASVREAISLLEGDLANEYGYTLDRNNIIYGNGRKYPISTQVYLRLKELGYDKQSMKTSNVVYVPTMNLKEMQNYCEIYRCNVSQVSNRKYKLEGADANRVIKELKGDGFISDSITDSLNDYKIEYVKWSDYNDRDYKYMIKHKSGWYYEKGFDTREEAEKYLKQHLDEIENWNKSHTKDSIKDEHEKSLYLNERYIIEKISGANESVYWTDDFEDAKEELRSLGRSYRIWDTKMDKYYMLKDIKDSVKDSQYKLKLDKKTNDYDEYVVACYKDGKYFEDGTYYTDDWDDAVGTMKDMSRRMGLNIRPQGRGYIADSIQDKSYNTMNLKQLAIERKDVERSIEAAKRLGNEYALRQLFKELQQIKELEIQKRGDRNLAQELKQFDSIQDSNKLYKVNDKYVSANNLVDAVKKIRNEKK